MHGSHDSENRARNLTDPSNAFRQAGTRPALPTAQPSAQRPDRSPSGPTAFATWYAANGWCVFPAHSIRGDGACTCGRADCPHPGKHPATPNGLKDATDDPAHVGRWWAIRPRANVAVATGAGSQVFVLDIDGEAGETALRQLEAEHGPLPVTRESVTGKGRHLWFRHPGGVVPTRTGLRPGIDVRGDGGYVLAPPSRHVSGARYRWRNAHPIANAPDWLLAAIRRAGADLGPANREISEVKPAAPASDTEPPRPLTPAAARAALKAEAEHVRRAQPGTRNSTLNRAAFKIGQLLGAALLDRAEAEEVLSDAARECGLGDAEIEATLRSGLNSGAAQPRGADDAEPTTAAEGVALTWQALLSQPDPEWLIDGVLMAGGLAVLYGPPKQGKSFVVLDMACSIAAGVRWQDHDTKAGRVVYISAEGTPKRRAMAWASANGTSADNLLVWTRRVNLRSEKERRDFVAAVRAIGWGAPVLVVVDTLSQNFGGLNENDADAMSGFIDALAKLRESLTGAAVLVVHHSGKDTSRGARGHSALPAAVDTMIEVSSDWFEASQSEVAAAEYVAKLTLHCKYQRDDEPFTQLIFGLRRVDLGYTDRSGKRARSLVVEPFDPSIRNAPKPRTGDGKASSRPSAKARERGPDRKAHALKVLRDAGAAGLGLNEWARQSGVPKATLVGWVQQWMESEHSPVAQRGGRYIAAEFAGHEH